MTESKKKVLVGSPIHQKPAILHEFLSSLLRLKQENVELSYLFVDDNEDPQSTELLHRFVEDAKRVFIIYSDQRNNYECNETTHVWHDTLIWKVAEFKNAMIEHAVNLQYDYLFLIDSDLVLHPDTIEHLAAAGKDIVSEIFWTRWQPGASMQPQVWLHDEYKLWEYRPGEYLSSEDIAARTAAFIAKLRIPGIYEVGGLGACTLISRHALLSGVHFKPIKNLSFWGRTGTFAFGQRLSDFRYSSTRIILRCICIGIPIWNEWKRSRGKLGLQPATVIRFPPSWVRR
ncbi:Glycosyl transferase family 2 [Paenibacillus konkukensis]|uniref:Glycosyl transferase family 2 n=1 Tax=Paenibacillus konkukensis TaxID=2020716 RepID=A0ABY4S0N8_9BACL|nr:Glycosyl transferase family 2 [Paenibacillus konkukensis]